MRFSTAWAKVAAQNVSLKLATVVLMLVTICQLGVIGAMSSKDALVVERGCYSNIAGAKPVDPNPDEIKGFLSAALPMRFDTSGYVKAGFLSIEELGAREKEQTALKERQMTQRILINDIKIENKNVVVTSDRVVSIGKVKSALGLNLKATLQQTNRTEANPYGLILTSLVQIQEKEESKQ